MRSTILLGCLLGVPGPALDFLGDLPPPCLHYTDVVRTIAGMRLYTGLRERYPPKQAAHDAPGGGRIILPPDQRTTRGSTQPQALAAGCCVRLPPLRLTRSPCGDERLSPPYWCCVCHPAALAGCRTSGFAPPAPQAGCWSECPYHIMFLIRDTQ